MMVEYIHVYEAFFFLQVNSYNALLKIGCNIIVVYDRREIQYQTLNSLIARSVSLFIYLEVNN